MQSASATMVLMLQGVLLLSSSISWSQGQMVERKLGALREVFAWTQLTYDINGQTLLRDRFGGIDEDMREEGEPTRDKRQSDSVIFSNDQQAMGQNWNQRPSNNFQNQRPGSSNQRPGSSNNRGQGNGNRPSTNNNNNRWNTTSANNNQQSDESGRFFIQYNNVPMGMERVGTRLFITVPRRRYGIPATLNYIDLARDSGNRSPALRPYPNLRQSAQLVSVYRTRDDGCGRLWMVDTGLLEIPGNRQQMQPPAIVVFDLRTNRLLRRYNFKSTDIPSANTPAGLASITVDVPHNDCENAFAYVPDLVSYGIIVYSWRENDSWRVTHNYVSFNPTAGNFNIAGQRFQWNDGIFSITLATPARDGCRVAYFHPMASLQEFSVNTCTLRNRTASTASDYWTQYNLIGERGANSQSTMNGFHEGTKVIFYADVGRDALSCWNTATPLVPSNVAILAQDSRRLSYPSDLHVTGDEVWVMSNTLPRFIFSRLDTSEYNFFIYRGSVQDLIANTACAQGLSLSPSSVSFIN